MKYSPEILDHCATADISIVEPSWFLDHGHIVEYLTFQVIHSSNAAYVENENRKTGETKRAIVVGDGLPENIREFVLWHEVGHILHPMGNGGGYSKLTHELAANAWALQNYPGDHNDLIPILRKGINSYIKTDETEAEKELDLVLTAQILGIHQDVVWIEND